MQIEKKITGKTKLIGLIGDPIEHSISPQLHNTISKTIGVDLIYIPLKVHKSELDNAVKGLKAFNFIGFNITLPHKKDIMKFIDDNTKEALLMGAVNTVKNIDGRFYGYNTDAEGFSRSFKEESGTGFKEKRVVIFGAGGVARAIAVKIAIEGAKKIFIINRTLSKASEVCDIINNNINAIAECYSIKNKTNNEIIRDSDIIINTTSLGMYPDIGKSPIGKGIEFSKHQIVYDAIYNPIKTKFLKSAEKSGCKIINGTGMLFYQGIYAYEIWTGIKLHDELIKELFLSFTDILKK
jgi:shikimate dehydrogenase